MSLKLVYDVNHSIEIQIHNSSIKMIIHDYILGIPTNKILAVDKDLSFLFPISANGNLIVGIPNIKILAVGKDLSFLFPILADENLILPIRISTE